MSISKKMRRAYRKVCKIAGELGHGPRGNVRPVDYSINERAAWKAAIDRASVGGRVGVVTSGMDCDCSKYYHERVEATPVSVFAWVREYERHCAWLDGPESISFVPPGQVEDGYSESRDLALEAFEDGHSHVVYG